MLDTEAENRKNNWRKICQKPRRNGTTANYRLNVRDIRSGIKP